MDSNIYKNVIKYLWVFGIALAMVVLNVNGAYAKDNHHSDRDSHDRGPNPNYDHGRVVRQLPPGHRSVWVDKHEYFYHGGHFYNHEPRGYVVVRPPVGAVILDLPFGYIKVAIGGDHFFFSGGAFYRHVSDGYAVVEAPRVPSEHHEYNYEAAVSVGRLNVRSGPGLDQAVVDQVFRGDTLQVVGTAENWLYVELPNGQYGWVMREYTNRESAPAKG